MKPESKRIRELFVATVGKVSPDHWDDFLAAATAGEEDLIREVRLLLEAHQDAGSFLEAPASAATMAYDATRLIEGPGTIIGPYKLMEQIGEGGMGVVYVAEQSQAVRRKVALKVIKPGMDSQQVIARFEAERQVLAMMDHPNIARIFDGGVTESGRPYFVMELVRGKPVTEYCDEARLSVRGRLELFVLVCRAVQHAHQKGVIHRDLKPSNILVTLHDGVPVPKVIDFGIAKAMGQSLTEKTVYTAFTQLVGTPLYMSPEQAEFSGLDIDTRSDIYSLGVLLYELLTGMTPFDQATFQKAAFDEVRRIIREQEPPKPSTRLSALCETLAEVSAKRGSDPRRLGKLVRGELDWVVMKCLEKDRSRRYETASGLAADVRRYLEDEPVQACPPSAWYRLSKAARHHRAALATAVLVGLALALGTAVSTWQAVRVSRAERMTSAALKTAEAQRAVAVAQRRLAEERSRQARRAVDEMYTQVAEKWLDQEPRMQEVQKEFLLKAVDFYREFTRERAVDPRDRQESARAYTRLGRILRRLGRSDESAPAYSQALMIQEELVARFPARAEYRRDLASTCDTWGQLYSSGPPTRGIGLCRRAVGLLAGLMAEAPRDVDSTRQFAASCRTLTLLLTNDRKGAEAETIARRAVDVLEERSRESPANAARLRYQLASSFEMLAMTMRPTDPRGAEEAYRRSIALFEGFEAEREEYPGRAYSFVRACQGLVTLLFVEGRHPEAEPHLRRSISLNEWLVRFNPRDSGHRDKLFKNYMDLARVMRATDRPEEAATLERRGRELRERELADHERRSSESPSRDDAEEVFGINTK